MSRAAALAGFATAIESHILLGTAVIYRATDTRDPFGGVTRSYAAIGTVLASLSPVRWEEGPILGAIRTAAAWRAILPHDADITEADQLRIGGTVFEVRATNRRASDRPSVWAECELLS